MMKYLKWSAYAYGAGGVLTLALLAYTDSQAGTPISQAILSGASITEALFWPKYLPALISSLFTSSSTTSTSGAGDTAAPPAGQ
jgi:hypothetical protein